MSLSPYVILPIQVILSLSLCVTPCLPDCSARLGLHALLMDFSGLFRLLWSLRTSHDSGSNGSGAWKSRGMEQTCPQGLLCPFSMARIASTSTIVQEALELPRIVDCRLCHVPVSLLPRGPHLWSPLSHPPFQELPTTNLFLADLIFLPTLTTIVYFFCFPILFHPFLSIPISLAYSPPLFP